MKKERPYNLQTRSVFVPGLFFMANDSSSGVSFSNRAETTNVLVTTWNAKNQFVKRSIPVADFAALDLFTYGRKYLAIPNQDGMMLQNNNSIGFLLYTDFKFYPFKNDAYVSSSGYTVYTDKEVEICLDSVFLSVRRNANASKARFVLKTECLKHLKEFIIYSNTFTTVEDAIRLINSLPEPKETAIVTISQQDQFFAEMSNAITAKGWTVNDKGL